MKKSKYNIPVLLFIALTVAACGPDSSETDSTSPTTPAVQNVNGNLPDTSNTINLNSSQPVDSSYVRDSLKPAP